MDHNEETMDATIDANGNLSLSHQPRLPPGPVRVTIRSAATLPQRGLADVVREIAAEQRAQGFPGRSTQQLLAEEDEALEEDARRDLLLEGARRNPSAGRP